MSNMPLPPKVDYNKLDPSPKDDLDKAKKKDGNDKKGKDKDVFEEMQDVQIQVKNKEDKEERSERLRKAKARKDGKSKDYFSDSKNEDAKDWQDEVLGYNKRQKKQRAEAERQGEAMEHFVSDQNEENNETEKKSGTEEKDVSGTKKEGETETEGKKEEEQQKKESKGDAHNRSGAEDVTEAEWNERKNEKRENQEKMKLKEDMKRSYEELLEKQKESLQTKNKFNFFKGIMTKVGLSDDESEIRNEYFKKNKLFEEAKKEWQEKSEKYYQFLAKDFKEKLIADGKTEEAISETMESYVLSVNSVVSETENENGEKIKVEKSIFNDFNDNLLEIEKKRAEILGGKDGKMKKILSKTIGNMNKVPRKYRIAIGVIVAGSIAGATGGVVAALSVGAYKLAKVGGVMALSAGARKALENAMSRESSKDFEKTKEGMVKGFSEEREGMLGLLDDFYKKEKARNRRKNVATAGAIVAFSGGIMALNFDDITNMLSGEKPGTTPIPISEMDPNVTKDFEVPRDSEMDSYAMEDFEKISVGKLNEGGTVWGTLVESDQFNGNEKEVAKTLAEFKANVGNDLVENQKMTADQANKYIEWKFRHMQPGDEIFIDKDGNLKIEGFDDEKIVDRFKASELKEDAGNAGETEEVVSQAEAEKEFDPLLGDEAAEVAKEGPIETKGPDLHSSNEDVLESTRNNLNENLEELDIPEDSNAWKFAENMKIKDLLDTLTPNDEPEFSRQEAWRMWRDDEIPVNTMHKLGGFLEANSNYGRLIDIAEFISEHKPNSTELKMSVEDFLNSKK
jgi:hypothetical protein